jgi:hypothetical protein
MLKEQLIGLACIAIGGFVLWWTIKYPNKEKHDPITGNLKGYIGSIGFIVVGVLLLIGYLKWK